MCFGEIWENLKVLIMDLNLIASPGSVLTHFTIKVNLLNKFAVIHSHRTFFIYFDTSCKFIQLPTSLETISITYFLDLKMKKFASFKKFTARSKQTIKQNRSLFINEITKRTGNWSSYITIIFYYMICDINIRRQLTQITHSKKKLNHNFD